MDKSNNKDVVSVTPPQANTGFTYKSNRVFRPIPPSTVDIPFFKKLYAVLKASTDEIADYDIAKLIQPPGPPGQNGQIWRGNSLSKAKILLIY